MATDLTGLKVKDTYNSLLKIGDNSSLSATPDRISDGLGNESALWLSTARVGIGSTPDSNYTLTVSNNIKTQSLDASSSITASSLRLTGGSGTQGLMSWNTDEETIDVVQNGAVLQLGQETHVHVKNQSGATINDGTPVYVTGTLGSSGRLTVAPMIADGSIEAKYFLGVTTEDIPNGEDGKVTTFGKIRGLNTSAYSEGQTLYVSSSTAGYWQTTRPAAPNLDLEVAIVINSHANNGTIFVRAQQGHYLGMLHDVYISSPANNQFLVYNSTTSRWENQGIASVGSINLDSVTDNGNTTTNDINVGDITAGNMTLSGYLRGAANFVIDPAAYGDETGVVQILGDLRVDGTTTTINSTTVTIDDKNIVLASGSATAADANGAGLTIDGASATMTYVSASDRFVFNKHVESQKIIAKDASSSITLDPTLQTSNYALTIGVTDDGIKFQHNSNSRGFVFDRNGTELLNIASNGNSTFFGNVTAPSFIGSLTGAASLNVLKAGDTMTGNLDFNDNVQARFGTGDDFKIYHNATNTLIDNETGAIIIRNFADDQDIVLASDDGAGSITDYLRVDGSEGSVILYHYGDQKLETTSTGVSVTGALSGNISTSSISGGTIDINGTTAINLQYNGSTQLRIDTFGATYLGTVSFDNDGISLDSTTDSFFHANVDYDAGLYTVTSNARYGSDYIQVDGKDSRSGNDRVFVISPKDIGSPDEDAILYLGGDNSITAPNTLMDWHTIEMNALSVQINNAEVATRTWVNSTLDAFDLQDVTDNGATTSNAISIYNSDAAANPRLSLGRGSTERLKFDVEDRVAIITHQQDESTGSHEMLFTIDSPAASKIFKWQQRLADGSSANQLMSLTSGELNTLNVTSTGYLQAYSYLYTRDNLLVLDSAGTGWNTWASRTSNGLYNLDVDSKIQFFNGQSGVPAAALSYNSNGFIYLKGGGGGVAIGNDDFGGAIYVNDNSTISLVAGSSTVADISAGSFGINNPLNVYNSATIHGSQVWSETTQGLTTGSIHIDPATGTDHAGGAITFGASDAAAGTNAQAGIYVRSDGSYGTKMYFSTTDSYATGSKTAMSIDQNGLVTINPRLDGAKSFRVYYDMDIYNTVNFTDASWNFKGSIRGNSSGDVIIRSGSAVETTFRSDGYLFAPTWINIGSGAGIYSSTNAAHFYPNTYSNYGTWRIDGERGNYSGILVNDVSAMPHIMYDNSGNGGLYNQGNGVWPVYYAVGNDCVAIGGSATSSGWKARVNGNIYVDTNVYAGTQVQASTATMGDLGSYARFGSNSATRGIVLSRDGTNYDFYVTPDGNTKVNKGLIDGVGKRMPIVGGGSYTTTASSVTGAIKISLPTTRYKSNTMMTFKVVVYEYNTGHTYEFRISGYNYSDAGATWYNEAAINLTDDGKNLNVRFGHDGTKNIVWIGETNTVWNYPQVFVEDLTTGYSGISQDDWADGWDVGFTTSFDSVSRNRPAARIGRNSIIDSLTVNNTVGIGTSGFSSTDLSINSGSNYPIQINTTQRYAVGFQNTSTSEAGYYPWLAHEYASKTTGAYSSMIVHFNGIGDKFWFNRVGDFQAARDIVNDGWYYNNSSSGMYWTPYGYGFRSANGAGTTYGHIATYNNGKSGWDGYALHRANMAFMGTTSDCGIYAADNGRWAFYYTENTDRCGIGSSTTSSSYMLYVYGAIYATNDIVAYSDRRVKENIINIDSALDKVKALQGVYYNRINDKDKVREIGFIAQDVHDAVPELASYAEDVDEWGVKYSQVTGLHNEAIKELAQELDKKDEQIANLQAQIDELKKLILNK